MTHACTQCKRESAMLISASVKIRPDWEPIETMVCPTCIVNAAHPSAFPTPLSEATYG